MSGPYEDHKRFWENCVVALLSQGRSPKEAMALAECVLARHKKNWDDYLWRTDKEAPRLLKAIEAWHMKLEHVGSTWIVSAHGQEEREDYSFARAIIRLDDRLRADHALREAGSESLETQVTVNIGSWDNRP